MGTAAIDTLLGAVSVEIEAFAICEISDGVRLIVPPIEMIVVHYILEGKAYVTTGGKESLEAGPGAMLIVPPERSHHLASSGNTLANKQAFEVCMPVREGILVIDATDGKVEPTLRIACGAVLPSPLGSFDPLQSLARPVLEDLSEFPVVSAAFAALLEEVKAPKEGSRALMSALMKGCLVMLLRRHLETSRNSGMAPAVFQDTRLSRAITAVLDLPAAAHSLGSLAKEAGMSRSAFAREFKTALDMTPMEFVARVRLDLAHRMLKTTALGVGGVAAAVGFQSRSHFSHLFRDHYGVDPSTFRRCSAGAQ